MKSPQNAPSVDVVTAICKATRLEAEALNADVSEVFAATLASASVFALGMGLSFDEWMECAKETWGATHE